MADRYSYTSEFGKGGEPWFKIGEIEVTTTIAIISINICTLFWSAIEKTNSSGERLFDLIPLETELVAKGQIWRILTWPFASEANGAFWALLSLVFFFLLGNQLEKEFGKKAYLTFLAGITITPAIIISITALFTEQSEQISGLSLINIGLILTIAFMNPFATFFLKIPAWAIAGVLILLELLTSLGNSQTLRSIFVLVLIVSVLAILQTFGRAHESLSWFPTIPIGPLKQIIDPDSKPKSKSKAKLHSVPTASEEAEMNTLLDKISETGMKSLTKTEKKTLKNLSNKMKNPD